MTDFEIAAWAARASPFSQGRVLEARAQAVCFWSHDAADLRCAAERAAIEVAIIAELFADRRRGTDVRLHA